MLVVSQGLLWLIVLLQAVAMLALARHIGVLHERIAPVGALAMGRGPQPGEAAPKIEARTLANTALHVGGKLPTGTLQLLFFIAPTCPVCKNLLPTAKAFAEAEALDLILVGDGDMAEHRNMATRFDIDLSHFVIGSEVGRAFHVGKLPYAVLISELGVVVAHGLVNSREHLESMIVAHETGLHSVQEYLEHRRTLREADSGGDRRDVH